MGKVKEGLRQGLQVVLLYYSNVLCLRRKRGEAERMRVGCGKDDFFSAHFASR